LAASALGGTNGAGSCRCGKRRRRRRSGAAACTEVLLVDAGGGGDCAPRAGVDARLRAWRRSSTWQLGTRWLLRRRTACRRRAVARGTRPRARRSADSLADALTRDTGKPLAATLQALVDGENGVAASTCSCAHGARRSVDESAAAAAAARGARAHCWLFASKS
jgi:hypothetical protein